VTADAPVPPAALDALQRWMLDALIAPERTARADIDARVMPGARIDATACLAIYQRSYLQRLRLCLGEQFPATRHALGRPLFDDFADEYLRACPSDSDTLYALGRRFSDWMQRSRPDRDLPEAQRERWIDFMVDLAHYEHALFRLFDAPGHEGRPWPAGDIDDAALVLQPCLTLAAYRYPVAWYYHEVRAGRSPPFPSEHASQIVVLRRDHRTTTYPVTPLHFRFLQVVQAHRDIACALAEIAAFTGRPPADVARSWSEDVRGPWIEAGFFVARNDLDSASEVG
jgi:Putative DNA-binding domain